MYTKHVYLREITAGREVHAAARKNAEEDSKRRVRISLTRGELEKCEEEE